MKILKNLGKRMMSLKNLGGRMGKIMDGKKFFPFAFFFQVWKRAEVRQVFLSFVFSIPPPQFFQTHYSFSEIFHHYHKVFEKNKSVFLQPWLSGPIGEVVPFAGPAIAFHQRGHFLDRIVNGVMRLLVRWTLDDNKRSESIHGVTITLNNFPDNGCYSVFGALFRDFSSDGYYNW